MGAHTNQTRLEGNLAAVVASTGAFTVPRKLQLYYYLFKLILIVKVIAEEFTCSPGGIIVDQ
jgi:hypothetical protein